MFPFASIGLPPQDLKYRGEPTTLEIGAHNIFREFVTIHRGTQGGGGKTTIGDRNLFMAYVHVAHDCHVGNETIFGNAATLGGHVTVEDYATISAYSGVHQFCRVGRHAFIGGYSVVTKDALPFAKTVGNRARIYGLNTVGLDPPRVLERCHRQAEAQLPVPAAVEAEHDERAARRSSRIGRSPRAPRCGISWISSGPPSAASSCGVRPAGRKRWWRKNSPPAAGAGLDPACSPS